MPTFGNDDLRIRRPDLWIATRKSVEAEMIAAGWNKHAKKFNEVALRRATARFKREVRGG